MTQADRERRERALHAMQAGVTTMMGIDNKSTTAKHLRVGVNSALCDSAALANLLMEKGVITLDEYEKALADQVEAEVERYKKLIKDAIGVDVDLV